MAKKYLKPQDIVVLARILTWDGERWTYEDLGASLQISASQAYYAVQRAEYSRLYDVERGRVRRGELQEFLVHGIRYAFAVQPGAPERGVPTAHSAPWAAGYLAASTGDDFVWPHPAGTHRGLSIDPLYKSVPDVVGEESTFYELLALVDVFRVGSRRERDVAEGVLADQLERPR